MLMRVNSDRSSPLETPATEPPPSDSFQWPPSPLPDSTDLPHPSLPRADASSILEPAPLGKIGRVLEASERAVLRPVIEPIERQIRQLGWQRDAIEKYCNRCGRSVGPSEEDEFGCSVCRNAVLMYDRVVRLGQYEFPLNQWVLALKFHRLRRFGERLGVELASAAREAGALESLPAGGIAVQAVPMSRRRRVARGIDHSAVLASSMARELGLPVVDCLYRRHRPSQRSTSSSERWGNVRGSIVLRDKSIPSLAFRRILMVDDVLTTGATARAGALALTGRPDARYSRAAWASAEVWHCVVATAE